MQSRVAKIYGDRQAMAAGEKLFDLGGAENLAYATLVDEGVPFASGVKGPVAVPLPPPRGDQQPLSTVQLTPLRHIHNGQGTFRVWDWSVVKKQCWRLNTVMPPEPRTLTVGSAVQ